MLKNTELNDSGHRWHVLGNGVQWNSSTVMGCWMRWVRCRIRRHADRTEPAIRGSIGWSKHAKWCWGGEVLIPPHPQGGGHLTPPPLPIEPCHHPLRPPPPRPR